MNKVNKLKDIKGFKDIKGVEKGEKWYSVKKFSPSCEGWYIIRYLDKHDIVCISYGLFNGKNWVDYNEPDSLFKGLITDFMIPDPVEIE